MHPRVGLVLHAALQAALVCVLAAGVAAQDCTSSPGGRFSFATSVSAGAGRRALYDVRVFAGATCDAAGLVGVTSLGSYRRLGITDRGVLVRILAPRTSHRDWNIVSLVVVGRAGVHERVVWLSLDELPGTEAVRGSVRASLDGSEIVFAGSGGEARVPFAALDGLAGVGDD